MAYVTRRFTGAAVLLAALYCARQRYRNWGANKGECQIALPGDTLVANPAIQTTEAVYIDDSPSAVWPWLLRMTEDWVEYGGRAGLKDSDEQSCDSTGGLRSLVRKLVVGRLIRPTPEGRMGLTGAITVRVFEVVPEKYIVFEASRSDRRWDAMWSFHIAPHLINQTRVVGRARIGLRYPGEVFAVELVRPAIALSMRGLLLGIKQAVEQQRLVCSAGPLAAAGRTNGPSATT